MTLVHRNPMLDDQPPYPQIVVISGPSGVGKDSVLIRMRELGIPFHFVVTMNSRPKRPTEQDGVDYHFVTSQHFETLIEQGELLEWAMVYGHYRGVPKCEVRQAIDSGQDVVIRVNVDGAATIRRIVPESIHIFIAPGSAGELRRRLAARRTESAEDMERRLALAEEEMAQVVHFDYVVINRDNRLDDAVQQIQAIMLAEKHRVHCRRIQL
ncbi:MAG: guanylate kinase [Chloroflexaceae bacterium]|nr:guanylate kinase [Chloroflexaceae bacterium]